MRGGGALAAGTRPNPVAGRHTSKQVSRDGIEDRHAGDDDGKAGFKREPVHGKGHDG